MAARHAATPSAARKVLTTFLAAAPPGRWPRPHKTITSFYEELELIHKLAMDLDKPTPDNNGTGKMDKGEVVGRFLFKTNKQLTETVEKRVSDFNHPASGPEVRIALDFFALLTSGTDMGSILTCLNGLGAACISGIQAEILRMLLTDGWTGNHNPIQRCL